MVKELIQISKYAGMREDLVQTGGGNSSVKLGPGCMLIKGMGVQMADMRSGTGYSVVDQRVFQTFFSQYQGESVTAEQGESLQAKAYLAGSRPAIETFFHALTGRVTLHTHPVLVNVLTARTGGMEILKEKQSTASHLFEVWQRMCVRVCLLTEKRSMSAASLPEDIWHCAVLWRLRSFLRPLFPGPDIAVSMEPCLYLHIDMTNTFRRGKYLFV